MNMVTRIAFQNMKYHKNKNILLGIAICLTTMLLFVIPAFGFGMRDIKYAAVNKFYPTWHALFRNVDTETVNKLAVHHDIAKYGLRCDVGCIVDDDADILLICMDQTAVNLYKGELESGRFPEKENEIVVSKAQLSEIGREGEIGDTIMVPFQMIRDGGLDYKEEKEFVISGFVKDNDNVKEKKFNAFVSQAFVKEEVPEGDLQYRFVFQVAIPTKNPTTDMIEAKIKEIASQFSIDENRINTNKDYLRANYVDPGMIPIIIGLMCIVVVAGIITIYCLLYVSMPERIQESGRLKAIGTTKRQLKQITMREVFAVGMIATPIGLLISTLITEVGVRLMLSVDKKDAMSRMYLEMINQGEVSVIHLWIYALTIVVVFLTIYLSLLKPMHVVAKVSEMEAIRYQSLDTKIGKKAKRRKSYCNISIFRLSLLHMKQNKKNFVITTVSMGITGAFLIVIATILSCADPVESANQDCVSQYEVSIQFESKNREHPEREWKEVIKDNPLNEELKSKIELLKGIDRVDAFNMVRFTAPLVFAEEDMGIIGVPDRYEKQIIQNIIEGSVTADELRSGTKVVMNKWMHNFYPIEIGNEIEITINDGEQEKRVKVTIAAVADLPLAFGSFTMLYEGVEALSNKNLNQSYQIFAGERYNKKIEEAIQQLITPKANLKLNTWQGYYNEWKATIQSMYSLCFTLLGILSAICIMNMINTMIHSVYIRKKSFGIMQAIGMTDGQLSKMLQIEGVFYTAGTLLMSIGIGSILGYPVYLWAKEEGILNISSYHYPYQAASIVVVVLFLIQMILGIALSRSARKESVIERIRFSE